LRASAKLTEGDRLQPALASDAKERQRGELRLAAFVSLTPLLIVYTIRRVVIEFDPAKDTVNKRKHGISLGRAGEFDFETATFVLDDRDYDETRFRALGFLDARLYALVFTQDGDDLRAISLRKATRHEEKEYEEGQ
jgi:hypothetical protein